MWKIDDYRARWSGGELGVQLDVRQPHRGITFARDTSTVVDTSTRETSAREKSTRDETRLLGLRFRPEPDGELELRDHYERGQDLVATYVARNFTSQIYWRIHAPDDSRILGCEVWLSLQTPLLDLQPGIEVSGELSSDEIEQLAGDADRFDKLELSDVSGFEAGRAPGVFLFRDETTANSVLLMIHPSDYRPDAMHIGRATDRRVRWEHEMLTERLEKGVIRRGRLSVFLVPRDRDRQVAVERYRQLAAESPPLTA